MPERVVLLRLLCRVRRRMRIAAAIEGVVFGTAAFLGAWAALFLDARGTPERVVSAGALGAVAAASLVVGAALRAGRRIPLARCARAVDRTAAGTEPRNGDRVLAAFDLAERGAQGPFVDAALRDAARMAAALDPGTAAPWRRPRGLGTVGVLAGATLMLALWPPPRAPAATRRTAAVADTTARRRIDPELLAADREHVEAAARAAWASADPELAHLTAELKALLAGLQTGTLDTGEALDRLADLERQAAAAAREAEALARGLRAAGAALMGESQTRKLASAFKNLDGNAGQTALEELASRASQSQPGERGKLSEALDHAALATAREAQRSLARNEKHERQTGQRGEGDPERQLRRLERDLSDSADRCQEDPEACKATLGEAAARLPQMVDEARRSGSREQLGRIADQLRERLRRLEPGDHSQRIAEQSFERAAAGLGANGMAMAGRGPLSSGAADGISHEAGGDLRGPRSAGETRGAPTEAKVPSGAGPTRADVIESGARRGFAETEYQRVFKDYQSVVEETLDTAAVPAGRRYLVRRYFQLIRPRNGNLDR